MISKNYETNVTFIKSVSFFHFLNDVQKENVARHLISEKKGKDEIIFDEGENADCFYVI